MREQSAIRFASEVKYKKSKKDKKKEKKKEKKEKKKEKKEKKKAKKQKRKTITGSEEISGSQSSDDEGVDKRQRIDSDDEGEKEPQKRQRLDSDEELTSTAKVEDHADVKKKPELQEAKPPSPVRKKMSKKDFFASVLAEEEDKEPIGTFHAVGDKSGTYVNSVGIVKTFDSAGKKENKGMCKLCDSVNVVRTLHTHAHASFCFRRLGMP